LIKTASLVAALAVLTLIAPLRDEAFARFKRGPELLEALPAEATKPLIWMGNKALARDVLPKPLVKVVEDILNDGKNVIIVGHADPVGPRLLNQALGLQYALGTAHRLVRTLMIESWRISCVSMGERDEKAESGIEIYAGEPPEPETQKPPSAVSILNPPTGGASTHQLWALWDNDASAVYWGIESAGDMITWRIASLTPPIKLPYPARSNASAIGAQYGDGRWVSGGEWKSPPLDPGLLLSVERLESGWALVTGRIPAHYDDIIVWSGGIPYPTATDGEKFEARVVRYGTGLKTYAQAANAKGHAVIGPSIELPRSLQDSPDLLAVLTWSGDADLDLHGWKKGRKTSPQDPDPDVSRTAAPGVRLLFDGDSRYRHSALWITGVEDLEIEVELFSDLGSGAKAVLYIIENPGDPVRRQATILGPRRLSDESLQKRWAAFGINPIAKKERIRVKR
jgi:hypothetical protein